MVIHSQRSSWGFATKSIKSAKCYRLFNNRSSQQASLDRVCLRTSALQGWGDVYYFCGSHLQHCNCNFRWNGSGWCKALVLWNLVLSSALGVQKLIAQLGLNGLLPGELRTFLPPLSLFLPSLTVLPGIHAFVDAFCCSSCRPLLHSLGGSQKEASDVSAQHARATISCRQSFNGWTFTFRHLP